MADPELRRFEALIRAQANRIHQLDQENKSFGTVFGMLGKSIFSATTGKGPIYYSDSNENDLHKRGDPAHQPG